MGQRLIRARAKIAAAGIPFAVPGPEAWAERLGSVLTVIYLVFNEGYSAGDGPSEVSLCDEAIFLAGLVRLLRPAEAEVEGGEGPLLAEGAGALVWLWDSEAERAQTYARGYIRGYTQTMTGQNEPSGNGPGYAIAARTVRPSSQIVLLLGDGAAGFARDGGYEVAWPAVLVSGRKP